MDGLVQCHTVQAGENNMIPFDADIDTTLTTIYSVPDNRVAYLSTIHVSNTMAAATTFTLYLKTASGTMRAISEIDQAIDAYGLAVCADPIRLSSSCSILAVAAALGLGIFISGKEVTTTVDEQNL